MSMHSEMSLPHCEYKRLENGIHEFVFLSNTHLAVDDYFKILDTTPLARGEEDADVLCVLIELRQTGTPPVTYMMLRSREFLKSHKARMPVIRIVFLYPPGFVLSLVQAFIDLFSERKHATRRFFPIDERAQAEDWLLKALS
jgi:hypothetical protein